MLEHTKVWIEYVAVAVDIATAAVIACAVIEALSLAVPLFVWRRQSQHAKVDIRLGLGRWLAVALEFALAADILRTAITPTWHDIGQLAAIAALRTALNYFLTREIEAGHSDRWSIRTAAEHTNTMTASVNSSP